MAQLLVRDVDHDTLARLKARARRSGRSLQGEVKIILIHATNFSLGEARRVSAQWQRRLSGHKFGDSTTVIREDRKR